MKDSYPYINIDSLDKLPSPQEGTRLIGRYAFIYIDFTKVPEYALGYTFIDCCFLGCQLCPGQNALFMDCLIFPKMGMIFKAYQTDLYTAQTLYEGYDPDDASTYPSSYDARVYKDYQESGTHTLDMRVMMARTLHDHSIYNAMGDVLLRYDPRDTIGIMGGHGIKRCDEGYWKIAYISKTLTEKGKLMVSGGGPGAMEATHLGAWMAGRSMEELVDAIEILIAGGDTFNHEWLSSAFKVREKYPQTRYESLAIPTYLYGHEPSTPLATHIAKYFTNSVREDMILTIVLGGVIFTPGSAGTMQEVFQNAAKLHYDTDGMIGPMVFLGKEFFTKEIPVYSFLKDLVERKKYRNLNLLLTDDMDETMKFVSARYEVD